MVNNQRMKKWDKPTISIIVGMLLCMWTMYLTESITKGVVVGGIAIIAVWCALSAFAKKSPYLNKYEYLKYLSVMGCTQILLFLQNDMQDSGCRTLSENDLLTESAQGTVLVHISTATGGYTEGEQARTTRLALDSNATSMTIIATSIKRECLHISSLFNLRVEFVPFNRIFRQIKKAKLIPQKTSTTVKQRVRIQGFREILRKPATALYLLSMGGVFFLFSFLTPLRTYYITIASLTLTLAVVALLMRYFDNR